MRIALMALALAASVGCGAPCSAQETKTSTETFGKFKPDELASILRDAGYRAEVVSEPGRSPRIRTSMAGYNIVIYLYTCADGSCGALQYSLGITKSPDFTLTLVNKWNQDKRFAKAHIDTGGNIYLEYDISFRGGVTKDTVAEAARLFDDLVGEFRTVLKGASGTR